MAGPVKTRSGLRLRVLMTPFRARIIFGNPPLIFAKHVYPKPFLGMKMPMRPGAVVHANQHQHGIQRHRRKSIRGHAVNLAVQVKRDNRDPGCEATHGLSELSTIQGHHARATAYITMPGRCIIRFK